VYVSKVFTDTEVPEEVLTAPNVQYGGTGFYYDKAPPLPDEVEHAFPDYHLYDEWVRGKPEKETAYYRDYSIGFLTRGCFRKCEFCVNKKYDHCSAHSPLSEFMDPERPKLCFLDDNFFACPQWEKIIEEVKATGKRFQFKQGLDERLLTDKKIHSMMKWKYDGDFIFAFDNIEDRPIIEKKLARIRELYPKTSRHLKFYVLCGFDNTGGYCEDFYPQDIKNTFERIRILRKYGAYPYVMRFEKCYTSRWNGLYSVIASWTNQPNIMKTFTFREYSKCKGMGVRYSTYKRDFDRYIADGNKKGSTWRYMEEFEQEYPEIAKEYFDGDESGD
jgi:hypothetical protein